MPSVIEPSDKLLDLIYDAATDPELWSRTLVEIADATNGVGAHIFGADSKPGKDNKERLVTFSFLGRLDENVYRIFSERHVINSLSAVMDDSPPGKFVLSDSIVPLPELQRTALFDEVLQPLGISHCSMVSLAAKNDLRVGLVIGRGERHGPHDPEALRFLSRLYPHIRRSLGLTFRLEGYKELQRAQYDVLDHLSTGVILLDGRARIIYANAAARSHSVEGGALRLRSTGVTTDSISHSRQLNGLIRSALLGTPVRAMSVPRPDGHLLTVLVLSVRGKDLARFTDAGLSDAAALVFVMDPLNRSDIPIAWIMDAYGLTQAEARVALAASAGTTVIETAIQLGLSPNTVKTHLRKVFAKTGTNRQAELARLLASIGTVRSNGSQ